MPNMKKPAPRGNEERAEQINLQATADTTIASEWSRWRDPAYRAERAKAHKVRDSLELSWTISEWCPSERWRRGVANNLAARGFDPDYLARRFDLSRREVAA